MPRIYFDSNVFSNLRNLVTTDYVRLAALIDKSRQNLSFVFSPAHLRDKRKDLTDHKYSDFDFMETLTQDNYLSYHAIKKYTTFYLATPRMAFDDEADGRQLSGISEIFAKWSKSEFDKTLVETTPNIDWVKSVDSFRAFQDPTLMEHAKSLSEKIGLVDTGLEPFEMAQKYSQFLDEVYSNHETYKSLRNIVDVACNNGRITLENNNDLTNAFVNSHFKQSYTDFVYSTLIRGIDGKVEHYDFFVQCYLYLDIFGVKKEKLSKKNTFINLFNDALHVYYAQYCDFFVSTDETIRRKAKCIYSILNINTTVLDVREFIDNLPHIAKESEVNLIHFFHKLWADTAREEDERAASSAGPGDSICYNTEYKYLNYFDKISPLRTREDIFYILCKSQNGSLGNVNFRERGALINRCLDLFGPDYGKLANFDFEREVPEVQAGSWRGRTWLVGDWHIRLWDCNDWGGLILTISKLQHGAQGNKVP